MALPLTVPKNGHANMPGNRYVTTPCVSSPEDNETHTHTHTVCWEGGSGEENWHCKSPPAQPRSLWQKQNTKIRTFNTVIKIYPFLITAAEIGLDVLVLLHFMLSEFLCVGLAQCPPRSRQNILIWLPVLTPQMPEPRKQEMNCLQLSGWAMRWLTVSDLWTPR